MEGIGKFSAAGIVLEFESKLFGVIKIGVKESRITLDDILELTFQKGLLKHGAKIVLRLKSYAKLSELPNREGKITMKIPRDDFDRAFEAVAEVNKALRERQEFLPPPHTSVSRLFEESEGDPKNREKN